MNEADERYSTAEEAIIDAFYLLGFVFPDPAVVHLLGRGQFISLFHILLPGESLSEGKIITIKYTLP